MQKIVPLMSIPLLLLSACYIGFDWVQGSGNVVSKELQVADFDRLRLEGIGEVVFKKAAEASVTLIGEDNIIDHIHAGVVADELVIRSEHGFNLQPTRDLIFLVSAPDLVEIKNSGSGKIRTDGELDGPELRLVLEGSGEIELSLLVDDLESSLKGSGLIVLEGRAENHTSEISGSGDIEAFELETQHSAIEISGSGDANLHAIDTLEAMIQGSGHVVYQGTPTVTSRIEGSGSVSKD